MTRTLLPLRTMIEGLVAAHLAGYVESPFKDRGGLILVGPPGAFKSAMLDVIERHFPQSLALTDANIPNLISLRNQVAQGSIRTLLFPELQKLYERDPRTADNVEGTIRAMVAEGFRAAAFEDARINRLVARCTVLAAVTPSTLEKRFRVWEETGFTRRFLWPLIAVDRPTLVEEAVEAWKRIEFDRGISVPPIPSGEHIPNMTTRKERERLRALVRFQPGSAHGSQVAILAKMLSAWKWWYREAGRDVRKAASGLSVFATALGREGATLTIPRNGWAK